MAYPSHVARSALRKALREHPDAETVLKGRLVNTLTLDQLKDGLGLLGLSHSQIVLIALHGQTAIDQAMATHPARDNPPQDEDEPALIDLAEVIEDAPDPIETELREIRGLIGTGGFAALDERLRELVTEARKPAVEVLVEVPAGGAMVPGQAMPASRPTGKEATWKALFGVGGKMGARTTALWDGSHPNTPKVNDRYIWPHPQTETALSQIARGRNVMLYGPAGTGKTEWAQQLAARTGRPFALISCDNGTDASTLVGLTVPAGDGVGWKDGALTAAIRTPGCVVCIDEPSVARPGALFVMQNCLANRQLFIAETGERVSVASGVVFLATDNTNGTGGGARKGYTDTNRLNAAFLDRFGVRVMVDYLPAADEAQVIVAYTGCTVELAQLLVTAAAVTRAAADNQTLSHGIGLRRLLSWAELLIDGITPEDAFKAAVLNAAAEQDVETLREQCLLTYDRQTVAQAMNPAAPVPSDPAMTNPTPAGRSAAGDFTEFTRSMYRTAGAP